MKTKTKSVKKESVKFPFSSDEIDTKKPSQSLEFSSLDGCAPAISYTLTKHTFSNTTLSAYSTLKNTHSKLRFRQQSIFFKSNAYHLAAYELADIHEFQTIPFTFLIPAKHHDKRFKEIAHLLSDYLTKNLKRKVEFTATIEFEGNGNLVNPHIHGLVLTKPHENIKKVFNQFHGTNKNCIFHDSTNKRNQLFHDTTEHQTILGWCNYSLKSYPSRSILKKFSHIHSDNIFATSGIRNLSHIHFAELVTNTKNRKSLYCSAVGVVSEVETSKASESVTNTGTSQPVKPKYTNDRFIKRSFTIALKRAATLENSYQIAQQHLTQLRAITPQNDTQNEINKYKQIQTWLDSDYYLDDIANAIAITQIIKPLCKLSATNWQAWDWNFINEICHQTPKCWNGKTFYELRLKQRFLNEIKSEFIATMTAHL